MSQDSTPYRYSGRTVWRNAQGELHLLDGPAIELADGYKQWFVDGKRHRLDGPAVEDASGYKAWYVDSKELKDVHSDADFLPYQLGCAL